MSDFEKKILSEAKIAADINEFFVISDLNDLSSDEEICDCLDSVSRYSKLYRDIHIELQLNLKDEYTEKYPNYDEITDKLRNYIKYAKRKIRFLKKEAEEDRQNENKLLKIEQKGDRQNENKLLKIEQKEEQKTSLLSEHNFFVSKLKQKLDSSDWNLINDPYDVNTGVKSLELALDGWYSLHGKLHGLFAEGYAKMFEETFHEMVESISEKVGEGKLRNKKLISLRDEGVRKLDEIRAHDEQEKILEEKRRFELEANIRINENKNCAKNLYDEIKVLNAHLCSRCNIDLEGLRDHHLLV